MSQPDSRLPVDLSQVGIEAQEAKEGSILSSGAASAPVRIQAMIVRRPGRVEVAQAFVESMLRLAAMETAITAPRAIVFGGEETLTGKQQDATLRTCLRTIEAYASGSISDEMMLEVDLPALRPIPQNVRMLGVIDEATGRVTMVKRPPVVAGDPHLIPDTDGE